ncbi:uncharacterized protein J8A68_000539 [[Candida] subhashii]|uniref:FAD-binding FR-type domain-containing protein n=1 Tax=[Candida] subhashii TaxID=561895 RepID=A0A8J5QJK3_9ASCO|nr:uncharacterized protein J8A68_000539 [[Candida] subhashii]KAG7665916.1 hypothetical protein J8A68_000539 [[Candida] subhashii]
MAKRNLPYEPYTYSRFFYACDEQIYASVSFCPEAFNYTCLCGNKNALATYAGCFVESGHNKTRVTDFLASFCKDYGFVELPKDWFQESYQYYVDNANSADEISDFNMTVPINVPFKINATETNVYIDSYNIFVGNYDDSLYYGAATLGYWALIVIIGAISNWSKLLFPGLVKSLTDPFSNYWRKYISMPAMFGKKRAREQKFLWVLDFLIPSRYESIVIFIFYILIIAIHSMNMTYMEGDPIFPKKYDALMRYVSDRTGIVATIMMPLVFLFSGRNNFLQWVTRWNYATFMAYHRHIARIMFVLVVIHAVGFTITLESYYAAEMAETYMIWGTFATVAGGLILVQAMLYLRRKWYEVFLVIHIILAAFWLAGTWVHVDELGYVWFVYPAVAVWCFDRLGRIIRLVAFGFPIADVSLVSEETIKVVIPKPSYWHSIPGDHAFVHFMKPAYFWQSHPFTFTDTIHHENKIVFYTKVKKGLTARLFQTLVSIPGRAIKMKVGVEGPYGEATAAKTSDTAVFVAGGNGIPGIYSEIVDIAEKAGQNSKKILKLFWVIREYKSLLWFYEELRLLKNSGIQTTIYVTRPDNLSHLEEFNGSSKVVAESDLMEGTDKEREKDVAIQENIKHERSDSEVEDKTDNARILEAIKSDLSHVEFKQGRPNLEELVVEEIHECAGSVSFVVCGAPMMVDDVRYYCTKNIDNGEKKRVDFYDQSQVWA